MVVIEAHGQAAAPLLVAQMVGPLVAQRAVRVADPKAALTADLAAGLKAVPTVVRAQSPVAASPAADPAARTVLRGDVRRVLPWPCDLSS